MIRCFCLYDITHDGNQNQLRNWHTLLQALSIRSDITIQNYPKQVLRNIDSLGFGKNYTGKHKIWIFDFELDNPSAVSVDDDSLYYLIFDTDHVPMISGMNETVKFDKNFLIQYGNNKNISLLTL